MELVYRVLFHTMEPGKGSCSVEMEPTYRAMSSTNGAQGISFILCQYNQDTVPCNTPVKSRIEGLILYKWNPGCRSCSMKMDSRT
jgi:hypothetical protein